MSYYITSDSLFLAQHLIEEYEIETCGPFIITKTAFTEETKEDTPFSVNSDMCVCVSVHTVEIDENNITSGEQSSCTIEGYTKYEMVWHTHSQVSKPYPSSQDIIKSLNKKYKNVSYHFIFTTWGIWQLSSFNPQRINEEDKKNMSKFISKQNEELYYSYKKKEMNLCLIQNYINNLENEFKNFGLTLFFTPWENISDNYKIIM
jgi:hypothetical protein